MTLWYDAPWHIQPLIRWLLTSLYLLVLLFIATYGLHRYWLVCLYYSARRNSLRPLRRFDDLPAVTIQLPIYNEEYVAERAIDAVCALDYPRDKLQIQVLDDSTDNSTTIAASRVIHWARRGVNIQYLHRTQRIGFKAGALADALGRATGQFIAIFDADFDPRPRFLRDTIDYFTDEQVGMVQTRWDHLNRDDSLLTRSQAIFLDSHFIIEHTARNRTGRWINFNGTAGIWRRQAIDDAGGWQHDTLTEDIDLSYRSQMAGWQFVFLPSVTCPAELPPEINAFKAQQRRWTKGSVQTAIKLLPRLLRASVPLRIKIEAFFHLTSPMVYLLVTIMALLLYPIMVVNTAPFEQGTWSALLLGMSLFALGTTSASIFYVASQREQDRNLLTTITAIPILMSIGVGIAMNNAQACLEALLGQASPFERTPKYNTTQRIGGQTRPGYRCQVIPTPSIKMWMGILEIAMGLYTLFCATLSLNTHHTILSTPFLFLFSFGYLYVGINSVHSCCSAWRSCRIATHPSS